MNFKNKRPRVSRGGCFCGGKWDKKVTRAEKPKYTDPPEEAKGTPRRKKNRRKWCKGRQGVHHKGVWIEFHYGTKSDEEWKHERLECRNCGRHLEWRKTHRVCGKQHKGWGHGWYFKDRKTGEYVRKPYPCEEEGTRAA